MEVPDRGFVTQRITAKDIEAGRIRVPAKSKTMLPAERSHIDVALEGKVFRVRWDPRNGPSRPRSGLLAFGRGKLQGLVNENEVLAIDARAGDSLELSSIPN